MPPQHNCIQGKGQQFIPKRAKAGGGDQHELWMSLETSYSSVWLSTFKHQHTKNCDYEVNQRELATCYILNECIFPKTGQPLIIKAWHHNHENELL